MGRTRVGIRHQTKSYARERRLVKSVKCNDNLLCSPRYSSRQRSISEVTACKATATWLSRSYAAASHPPKSSGTPAEIVASNLKSLNQPPTLGKALPASQVLSNATIVWTQACLNHGNLSKSMKHRIDGDCQGLTRKVPCHSSQSNCKLRSSDEE
jgi:hypothetical protein